MSFRTFARASVLGTAAALLIAIPATAKEPVTQFLEALRDREMHDMAELYLESLRDNPNIDSETRQTIPLEQGRTIVDKSRTMRDMTLRMKELDKAQAAFEEFLKANSEHPQAGMARIQLGNVLNERGIALAEQAKKPTMVAQKDELQKQAREKFAEAIKVFESAVTDFEAKWKSFPKFIEKSETKQREAKEKALNDLILAQLYRGTAIFESARAHDEGSEQHTEILNRAAAAYHELFEKYRRKYAGLYAGMLEANCYQKMGDLRRALGIYDELLAQPDEPDSFRLLKLKVLRLALEAWCHPDQQKFDEAVKRGEEMIKKFRGSEDQSPEGLAVQYWTAVAQDGIITRDKDKKEFTEQIEKALKRDILVHAKQVADRPGEYQKPAKELLAKHGRAPDEEPQTFTDAKEAGKNALTTYQVRDSDIAGEKDAGKRKQLIEERDTAADEAVKYFRLAIRLSASEDEVLIDELNVVRYYLSYLYYKTGRHLDAAVMGEFLARHYPQASGARQGAKIAMAGYLLAYNNARPDEREFETQQMVRVARYITEQWPTEADADEAWMMLGDIAIREKDLDQAAKYLSNIPAESPRRADADLKAGQALWASYLQARADEAPADVTAPLLAEAEKKLAAGVAAERQQMDDGNVTYDLLAGELSLAQLYLNNGRAQEAVDVLESARGPLQMLSAGDEVTQTRENFGRETYKAALRAYVAVGDMDKAQQMMKALEESVQGTPDAQARLTQIYISLGQEVQEQLKAPGADREKLLQGFDAFLVRIKNSKEGNTLSSLNWVAETYFNLAAGIDTGATVSAKAKEYYTKASETYETMLNHPEATPDMKVSLNIRQAKCMRRMGSYNDAVNQLFEVLGDNNMILEAQKEACLTFQDWAAATKKASFFDYAMKGYISRKTDKPLVWGWARMANMVARNPKFQSTYFEARWSLANSRLRQAMMQSGNEKSETLQRAYNDIYFTYRQHPKMGGDTWWPKFESLLKTIQRAMSKPAKGLQEFEEQAKVTVRR